MKVNDDPKHIIPVTNDVARLGGSAHPTDEEEVKEDNIYDIIIPNLRDHLMSPLYSFGSNHG